MAKCILNYTFHILNNLFYLGSYCSLFSNWLADVKSVKYNKYIINATRHSPVQARHGSGKSAIYFRHYEGAQLILNPFMI
jgi:hypothetical protein